MKETILFVNSETYTADVSLLLTPATWCEATIGGVVTYLSGVAHPAIIGGYCSSRVDVGTIGTLELRYDYRDSIAQDFATTFAEESTGRIIVNIRW